MMKIPSSTLRLRAIRDSAYTALSLLKPESLCVRHEITLHFFEDCCIVYTRFSQGTSQTEKIISVYSKDLKEWKPYNDSFEPKEGFHKAIQYSSLEEPFPTKEW